MDEQLRELGLKKYKLGEAGRSNFVCPYCKPVDRLPTLETLKTRKLIGWIENYPGLLPFAVFECGECFEKYYHHLSLVGNNEDKFFRAIKRQLEMYG
jgi:ribosome modulation factor